jgi:ribosome-associated toxin RatA of RatAB toxin-antitoxin module
VHSTVAIEVAAPPELIFRLARDVRRWPHLLPHYSSVRVLARFDDGTTTVRMVARRPLFGLVGLGLPVVWRSRVWVDPARQRLRFRHLGGATAGMDVTWRIERTSSGCRVAIDHDFRRRLAIPVLASLLGDEVFPAFVDRWFTKPIATRTLAVFGALAEALAEEEATSDPAVGTYSQT